MAIGLNHNTASLKPNEDSFSEIGSIYVSARSTVPTGYLLCDGSAVSRTIYSFLFSAISTTYGSGDGTTTFNIPDLRGAVPRGAGTSNGYTQNVTLTLGTKQNDAMQGHRHNFILYLGSAQFGAGGSHDNYTIENGTQVLDPTTDGTNGTPRIANETRMKNQVVNFFIKF